MPLLVVVFLFLNLNIHDNIEPTMINDEHNSIFGAMTSNEAILQGLLTNELFVFLYL
jgi:hypothetical protein